MEKMGRLAERFIEDVNKDDSTILELFGKIIHFLFGFLMMTGIPFVLYLLLQFWTLI